MAVIVKSINSELGGAVNNGCFARQLSLPDTVNQVRVGIRGLISYPAGLTATPRVGIGLCKGTTNILGDLTTDFFVGVLSTSVQWIWYAGNDNTYWTFSPATYEGSTLTTGTAVAVPYAATANFSAPNSGFPEAYFVDIRLAGGTIYIRMLYPTAFHAQCSSADFFTQMAIQTPSITGHTLSAEQTVVGTTTNFWANRAVNFWWNRTEFDWNVLDLSVRILS